MLASAQALMNIKYRIPTMINRVLIRMKVVQLLYSYFLVQNNFSIQSAPEAPTKEKRFAYSLYLDYLYAMMEIAKRVTTQGKGSPLLESRFIQRLAGDNIFKSLSNKYAYESFLLSDAIPELAEEVKNSPLYKAYLKDPKKDSLLWQNIFKQIIAVNPRIDKLAEGYENYSMRGIDRAKDLITTTFEEFATSQDNVADGLAGLSVSLEKARELYMRLLMLPIDITYEQEVITDNQRSKAALFDLEFTAPNPKFIDNELVKLLASNETIRQYSDDKKISWVEQDRDLIRHLLKKITSSELFREYMEEDTTDLHADTEFWRKVMLNIVLTDDKFLETLENKSVFWNDDLEIMGEFALKTFRRFEEKAIDPDSKTGDPVLAMYKDKEDQRFGKELFEITVKNNSQYRKLIEKVLNTSQWESDRLAFMDVIIMETALAEILSFPKIPLQASLNEYIEIAKSYSSPKSGSFINGLLGAALDDLREAGKLRK